MLPNTVLSQWTKTTCSKSSVTTLNDILASLLSTSNAASVPSIATDETAKKQNLVVDNSECFNDSCETSEVGNILKKLRFKNSNTVLLRINALPRENASLE